MNSYSNPNPKLNMKHSPFPWRYEETQGQVLGRHKSEPMEQVICEPMGDCENQAIANGRMLGQVGNMFEIVSKLTGLINCPDGQIKVEGKCVELLAEIIRLCPERVITDATGFYD